jgi:hypothetical protein
LTNEPALPYVSNQSCLFLSSSNLIVSYTQEVRAEQRTERGRWIRAVYPEEGDLKAWIA